MHPFTDATGRTWRLTITTNELRRVNAATSVRLSDLSEATARQLMDPVNLVDVLFAIVAPQNVAPELTLEQFSEAMVGEVLNEAWIALMEAMHDFFQNPQRAQLRRAIDQWKSLTEQATREVATAGK